MCGGSYSQWDKPRQLYEIHNEPIVARTIRLLQEEGVRDIFISSNDPRFEDFVPVLYHTNRYKANGSDDNGHWTDCFYPTDEPTTYLFGDVVFSPEAIHKIVATETDSIQFFASAPPFDPRYIKRWAEPFALKVVDQERLKTAIEVTKQYARTGFFRRKPIMWELWQVITNCKLNVIDYKSYVHINDYTCDIDNPSDLKRIEQYVPYTVRAEVIS
jgi:hypothetical protein